MLIKRLKAQLESLRSRKATCKDMTVAVSLQAEIDVIVKRLRACNEM